MKDTTKEFAKDCGNVAIEGAKALALGEVICTGSSVAITDILAKTYNLGCKILGYTPEGKALETAITIIGYSGFIGGAALGIYLNNKCHLSKGFEDALADVTKKYSKKDSVVTVKFDWKPVMPE